MFGLHHMARPPFHTVYLHGLVVDPEGKKMSKTKGNVQEPLELIAQYGADAVRFALTTGTTPGNNIRITQQRLESSRNFVNKLWNASRFVLLMAEEKHIDSWESPRLEHVHDQWILSELSSAIIEIDKFMREYQFGEAQKVAHDFLWHHFCDWYIELAKIRLKTDDIPSPLPVLLFVLEKTLRLLHPFLPFVTEEIWRMLRSGFLSNEACPDALILADYPREPIMRNHGSAVEDMASFFDCIKGVRNIRAELRIQPNSIISYSIESDDEHGFLQSQKQYFAGLAGLSSEPLEFIQNESKQQDEIIIVTTNANLHLELRDAFNKDEELLRLAEEHEEILKYIKALNVRLSNSAFRKNAPQEIVRKEETRLESSLGRKKRLEDILAALRN